MNQAFGALILLVSLTLLVFCLRNFYASPSRFNLRVGWCAMALYAAMASFGAWMSHRLSRPIPHEFYDLPSGPGTHDVVLKRPGEYQGYAARLVDKGNRQPVRTETMEKLRGCGWEVPGEPVSFYGRSGFLGWETLLLDWPSVEDRLVLRYRVTEETRLILADLALEVTAYSGTLEGQAIGRGIMQMYMTCYLIGLLIAASSVTVQRRKMREQRAAATSEGPPPPVS